MIVVGQDVARPRRLVAVALTESESVQAGGALAELSGSTGETDLLVVRNDPAGPLRMVEPADAEDYPGEDASQDPDDSPMTMPVTRVPSIPVRLHRLGLRWTVRDADEPDLVAALSELVGFDPDDDTYCAAPALTGAVADPEIEVVRRAVQRVARVYGLPVLPYRCPGADGVARVTPPMRVRGPLGGEASAV
ncbi:hypothetical protein SAMN05216207_100794 [Pseudonocardia ammonioxydans]|uniref:Uncharacterized protein n=1 Tax=Pseudonocardia ammonioxydans TaxID=260086 RepID=A0A1I4VZN7_PSUAM|nr:hypothetical protein [Pseudonocardia ammonioxydans]SFN06778.1 hypothetical protein SAMN05216207_100794 [Pseudonocardia ammonioxydans]